MKKGIQNEKGEPIVVDMTPDEIAEMQKLNEVEQQTENQMSKKSFEEVDMTIEDIAKQQTDYLSTWHNPSKPIRVILSLDCLRLLNVKKEFIEAINQVYTYFKSTELEKHEVGDDLYIYLSEIYPEHKALLEANGANIETL